MRKGCVSAPTVFRECAHSVLSVRPQFSGLIDFCFIEMSSAPPLPGCCQETGTAMLLLIFLLLVLFLLLLLLQLPVAACHYPLSCYAPLCTAGHARHALCTAVHTRHALCTAGHARHGALPRPSMRGRRGALGHVRLCGCRSSSAGGCRAATAGERCSGGCHGCRSSSLPGGRRAATAGERCAGDLHRNCSSSSTGGGRRGWRGARCCCGRWQRRRDRCRWWQGCLWKRPWCGGRWRWCGGCWPWCGRRWPWCGRRWRWRGCA